MLAEQFVAQMSQQAQFELDSLLVVFKKYELIDFLLQSWLNA